MLLSCRGIPARGLCTIPYRTSSATRRPVGWIEKHVISPTKDHVHMTRSDLRQSHYITAYRRNINNETRRTSAEDKEFEFISILPGTCDDDGEDKTLRYSFTVPFSEMYRTRSTRNIVKQVGLRLGRWFNQVVNVNSSASISSRPLVFEGHFDENDIRRLLLSSRLSDDLQDQHSERMHDMDHIVEKEMVALQASDIVVVVFRKWSELEQSKSTRRLIGYVRASGDRSLVSSVNAIVFDSTLVESSTPESNLSKIKQLNHVLSEAVRKLCEDVFAYYGIADITVLCMSPTEHHDSKESTSDRMQAFFSDMQPHNCPSLSSCEVLTHCGFESDKLGSTFMRLNIGTYYQKKST